MTAIAEETTRTEQQTPAVISGVVDLGDGRGFLRTTGYRRSGEDIRLPQLRSASTDCAAGDHIQGTAVERPTRAQQAKPQQAKPRQGRAQQGKTGEDKTLLTVEFVNGLPAAEAKHRPDFDDLTPVYPNQRSVSRTATRPAPRGSST